MKTRRVFSSKNRQTALSCALACVVVGLVVGPAWAQRPFDRQIPKPPDLRCWDPTVGMDAAGRFAVGYVQDVEALMVMRYQQGGGEMGVPVKVNYDPDGGPWINVDVPSLTVRADGRIHVVWPWVAVLKSSLGGVLHQNTFEFDLSDFHPIQAIGGTAGNYEPSAGLATDSGGPGGFSDPGGAVAWASDNSEEAHGLLYNPRDCTPDSAVSIRACDPLDPGHNGICFTDERWIYPPGIWRHAWQPCMSQRSDGTFAVAWADPLWPQQADSPFHIMLMLFAGDGKPLTDKPVPVDETTPLESVQFSPAVAFDDRGNIVVVWAGPGVYTDPGSTPSLGVFARRFYWDGDVLGPPPEGPAGELVVNNDSNFEPLPNLNVNPTVALSPNGQGDFVVAWNAKRALLATWNSEVHARYWRTTSGWGHECRVNQNTGGTGGGVSIRRLANSAQHTLVYGPAGDVVATWTTYSRSGSYEIPQAVFFTWLPPGYGG